MSPVEVLRAAVAAGFRLEVTDGRLMASPKARLLDAHRALLREHRPALLALLTPPALTADDREAIEEHIAERAAVAEFDGGLSRVDAEAQARGEVRAFRLLVDDDLAPSWQLAVTAGADPEQRLFEQHGRRLLAIHPILWRPEI